MLITLHSFHYIAILGREIFVQIPLSCNRIIFKLQLNYQLKYYKTILSTLETVNVIIWLFDQFF
jgi:hypothetical protein